MRRDRRALSSSTAGIDPHRVGDEWDRTRPIARTLGFIFFGLGVVLLILIIYAMTVRLRGGHEGMPAAPESAAVTVQAEH